MEVTNDPWASLLPDLLLDIFCCQETTAVVRCAATCKPWRRIIISNASSLRPCPDRYNPNLLLGFFHRSWYQGTFILDGSSPRPPVTVSVTAVDTGHCERLSSFIPPASAGGIDLSLSYNILASRDGFLLLGHGTFLNPDVLCLCNPLSRACTFLPSAPSPIMEKCEYVLLTSYDLSLPGTRDNFAVRILAIAGAYKVCTDEGRLAYQVFSCSEDGGGAGVWGAVQHSEVNEALRMLYGKNTVVGRDAVHWLAGDGEDECRITCTVSLDIYTGRAWVTELPKRCRSYYSSETPCALTTSGDGRLSLLKPLADRHIQVWVLDGGVGAMEWTMQHKIWIDKQIHPDFAGNPRSILGCNYPNVVCPRSGLLFIMFPNRQQLRIDLESRAHLPVHCIGKRDRYHYYPYEMDWSTYISKMKNF